MFVYTWGFVWRDNSRIVRLVLRNINGRPHRVAPTASEQAALRSDDMRVGNNVLFP